MTDELDQIFVDKHPEKVYINDEIVKLKQENLELMGKLENTRDYLRLTRKEVDKCKAIIARLEKELEDLGGSH